MGWGTARELAPAAGVHHGTLGSPGSTDGATRLHGLMVYVHRLHQRAGWGIEEQSVGLCFGNEAWLETGSRARADRRLSALE